MLLAATLAGGLLSPGRQASEAQAATTASTPPGSVSQSFYIEGAAGSALNTVLYNDGGEQATADCNSGNPVFSYVILDFGAQQIPGTETESVDGTDFYTQSQIGTMALNFAEGYAANDAYCLAAFDDANPSGTDIIVGTSNSGPVPTAAQASSQASAWWTTTHTAAENYNTWASEQPALESAGIEDDVDISPGDDIENGYNPASATVPWANELDSEWLANLTTNDGIPWDFGSVDGCYSSTGTLTSGFVCATGWTINDVNTVITDLEPAPQIYLAPPNGEQPAEWTQVCVYYVNNISDGYPTSPLFGSMILAEPTGGSTFLSSADAWNDFLTDLQASGNTYCATEPPFNETNDDESATPSGNTIWP
jgi:hypothetical protein